MTGSCPWCDGSCRGADLDPLLSAQLLWLWQQVGATADLRGDPGLSTGMLNVRAPAAADERAAAVGLLGGPLRQGQRRRVDLSDLTDRLHHRGAALTPGAVAAHALRRRLAVKAAQRRAKAQAQESLREALEAELSTLPVHVAARVGVDDAWQRISRAGTVGRLLARPDADALVSAAGTVLRGLPPPGGRVDRRTLVAGDPHALDAGQPLANLVLALTGQTRLRPRPAWAELGVDIDDLTGGLISLGLQPRGWTVPAGAVLTLPPRELLHVTWPSSPGPDAWVFVTENPSVLAAAADALAQESSRGAARVVRLLCTSGTPSAVETGAIAALAEVGWRIAVRADFDPAGLFHVRTLLAACPTAVAWRMDADTYRAATAGLAAAPSLAVTADDTPWDRELGNAIRATGIPGYEEALHALLIQDLLAGSPS